MHKAGFVNIVGLPNVGKSTLMNALMGEKMSIITPKAQTTRHRIRGIWNGDDYQVVFCDTPGYITQPAYKLQANMNEFVEEAFTDADIVLFVTDKFQKNEEQAALHTYLQKSKAPVVVAINKLDLCKPEEAQKLSEKWQADLPSAIVFIISAEHKHAVNELRNKIIELLPESPPYFEKDQITDRAVRFFVTEIVREKLLLLYDKEIPYSCEVEIESFKEAENIDRIRCNIFVERESQKAIIIGNKGEAIKKLGIESRKSVEQLTGKQAHLELFVKVKDKWRNDENALRKFGYKI